MQEAAARPRCAGRGLWGRNRGGLWGWGLTVEHMAAKRPRARTAAASISPSTVLRALWVPPTHTLVGWAMPCPHWDAHQAPGPHSAASPPSLPLFACPSFSSCSQHPFMQSTHCSCPRAASPPGGRTKRTAPASPWHPRWHQAGVGLQGARADVIGIQDLKRLLPLPPSKTLQQFFLQSLGGQEECLII